ncbi:MAG: DUF4388 domain-containing protein [Nitrospirae bacterium]|nr:DUF4388 domain-containing protein [Nitrospirota bacterium]
MALIGNLNDLNISNIIQLNCMEKNTSRLSIKTRGRTGIIFFEGGQITHAEFDNKNGEDAVYKMLGVIDGEFKVENGVTASRKTIKTSWNSLLLEGMRILDEASDEKDKTSERLSGELKKLNGVKDVLIFGMDGRGKKEGSSDEVYYIVDKAAAIGELLNFGSFHSSRLNAKDERMLIIRHEPYYLQVRMDSNSLVEMVDVSINNILNSQLVGYEPERFRPGGG